MAPMEMLESQLGWGDKSYPHCWVLSHPGPPGTGLAVLVKVARNGTGRLMGTDPRDDHGPVHFLWTWTLAYSE